MRALGREEEPAVKLTGKIWFFIATPKAIETAMITLTSIGLER